ncbi:MAG: ThuA domain-containing protein [Oligosphaeraceae bacterium]
MIHFFADQHYGARPGARLHQCLSPSWRARVLLHEEEWGLLEEGRWREDCELLVLNMIGGTCDQPHPGEGAARAVRAWCEKGGNLLLIHGGSAAFWQWAWWRQAMAMRWVRPGDPEGVTPSFHPVHPYRVSRTGSPHPLAARLQEMELPQDEIYAGLACAPSLEVLMETRVPEGCFPQCALAPTPWGGIQLHFLPGHRPETFQVPALVENVERCLEYLLV